MVLAGFGKQSFNLPGVLTEIICGSLPVGRLRVSSTASLKGFSKKEATFRGVGDQCSGEGGGDPLTP